MVQLGAPQVAKEPNTMSTPDILKLVMNLIGAAGTAWLADGSWEAMAAAAAAMAAGLFQRPPWRK